MMCLESDSVNAIVRVSIPVLIESERSMIPARSFLDADFLDQENLEVAAARSFVLLAGS
jgi:hypothetical protein